MNVYVKKTGEVLQREPVDAREMCLGDKSLYTLTDPNAKAAPEGTVAAVVEFRGSPELPGTVDVGNKKIPLAEVLAAAAKRAGMTAEQWNAQGDKAIVDAAIAEVENMKAVVLAASLVPGTGTSKGK